MLACVCVAICALALRTVQVQVLDGGALARAAESQQRVTVPLWAPRGPIVDRTGQTLALSFRAVTVGVWPARIDDRTAFAQALSTYTKITPATIEQRMGGTAQYVFVARRLDPSTWTRIKTDPVLGPLVEVAGDRAASRSLAASTPTAAWPHRSSARRRRPLRASSSRATTCSARTPAWPPSRRSTTGRPAMRTGRGCCTCASRGRARPCSSRSTRASSGSSSRRSRPRRARWHAKAVTAVVLDTHTGGILAMAAAPGVPPPGLPRRQSRGVAPARHHRPLRARLDVQARDLHGRPAGGRDHCRARRSSCPTRTRRRSSMHPRARSMTRTRTTPSTGPRARSSLTPRTSARSRSPRSAWASPSCRSGSRTSASASSPGVDLPGRAARACRCRDDKWYGTGILNVPIGESIAVTPLQMAALYASIANGGQWIQPHITAAIGGKPITGWKQAPAGVAARRPRAARHAHRRRRLRHRHAGARSRATASRARPARRRSTTPSTAATATRTRAIASTRRRSSASRPPSTRASSRS